MSTKIIKSIRYKTFALFKVYIFKFYALLVTFQGISCVWNKKKYQFKKDFRSEQYIS